MCTKPWSHVTCLMSCVTCLETCLVSGDLSGVWWLNCLVFVACLTSCECCNMISHTGPWYPHVYLKEQVVIHNKIPVSMTCGLSKLVPLVAAKVQYAFRHFIKLRRCLQGYSFETEEPEGGCYHVMTRAHVMTTINWHFKAKKCGCKLNKQLHGQSHNGRGRRAWLSTRLKMLGT